MKKNHFMTMILCLLFLAGLSLLLYPFAANQWNSYRQSRLLSTYEETLSSMESAGTVDYDAEWARAKAYNDVLVPYILPDSFAEAELHSGGGAEYNECLNLTGDGMIGSVEIPKINVNLPIFHTTNEAVLQKGAGHLEGSTLPIGGVDGHAVISAHRGLPSAALFTDLDQLQEGDYFVLHILDDTLCYQVDLINVVEPSDTSDLNVVEGMDLVTLLTCTPYSVNSHRLLVRGHRVEYEDLVMQDTGSLFLGPSVHTSYLLWVLVGLGVTGAFILLLYLIDRRLKKRAGSFAVRMGAGKIQEAAAGAASQDAIPKKASGQEPYAYPSDSKEHDPDWYEYPSDLEVDILDWLKDISDGDDSDPGKGGSL